MRVRELVVALCCTVVLACRGDELPAPSASGRATFAFESAIEITALRSRIIRRDGIVQDVGEEELFLAAGNRAIIHLTVRNGADGWAPINFELCVDHRELLNVVDPQQAPEVGGFLPDPCSVRYRDHEWFQLKRGQEIELFAGAVEARLRTGGGYITVYFRVEFPDRGVYDLYEYTVPYRVLPSGEISQPLVLRARLQRITRPFPPS